MERDLIQGRVVVGADGSPDALHAIEWAADAARREGRELFLMHVADPVMAARAVGVGAAGWYAEDATAPLRRAGRAIVDAAVDAVREFHPDVRTVPHVVEGSTIRSLVELSRLGPRMIVLGSRGLGPFGSAVVGSCSLAVARRASCPVVVVRPYHRGRVRRGVLVGDDHTAASRTVVAAGFAAASERDLGLTVLHCAPAWSRSGAGPSGSLAAGADKILAARLASAEVIAGLREQYPDVHVAVDYARGVPWRVIADRAARMDLVVIGRNPRGRFGGLFGGSTATAVLEHAVCPVMTVGQPEP